MSFFDLSMVPIVRKLATVRRNVFSSVARPSAAVDDGGAGKYHVTIRIYTVGGKKLLSKKADATTFRVKR